VALRFGLAGRLANTQMGPTRLKVRAIVSLRRAAQRQR
jgi:hypothetical protein